MTTSMGKGNTQLDQGIPISYLIFVPFPPFGYGFAYGPNVFVFFLETIFICFWNERSLERVWTNISKDFFLFSSSFLEI